MAEYIEREALLKFIENGLNNPDKTKAFGYDAVEIMTEVQYAPAADVVERKRGEWEFVEQRFYHGGFINLFRCSECSAATDKEYNFCPNCGADMRGDTDV